MNLINTRKSVAIARKGHGILKRKREVLVIEFLKLLRESKNDRAYLYNLLQQGYKTVAIASTYVGDYELERVAASIDEASPIRIILKNIMGVKVPEINIPKSSQTVLGAGYSVLSTSAAIDDVSDSFNKVTGAIIDMAKREQGLKRLVIEIDKTKRRVNALEYVVIPGLRTQAKYIAMRLDEMDRDTFSALKHVKKRLEKTKKAEAATAAS